jgi:ankyrin repeat protein
MEQSIKNLIEAKDHERIRKALSNNPNLANDGIPCDEKNPEKAHPLHRICDAVFSKRITDDEAIEIAKIFLANGAMINGDKVVPGKDSPLIAAASLHAEQLCIFYIDKGANVHHIGTNGATALHWAAYCGRDKLVKRLLHENVKLDLRDSSFNATPLSWAVHSLMTSDNMNRYKQVECIKLLLKAGSDKKALGEDMTKYLHKLAADDSELRNLLA